MKFILVGSLQLTEAFLKNGHVAPVQWMVCPCNFSDFLFTLIKKNLFQLHFALNSSCQFFYSLMLCVSHCLIISSARSSWSYQAPLTFSLSLMLHCHNGQSKKQTMKKSSKKNMTGNPWRGHFSDDSVHWEGFKFLAGINQNTTML